MHNPGQRRHDNPWKEAPDYAIEIGIGLSVIIQNQEKIMSAIDDLKTAIAAMITEATGDVASLVTQINTTSNQDPAIVDLTKQVTDATTALHQAFTGATGVVLPPATPAPAPANPAGT